MCHIKIPSPTQASTLTPGSIIKKKWNFKKQQQKSFFFFKNWILTAGGYWNTVIYESVQPSLFLNFYCCCKFPTLKPYFNPIPAPNFMLWSNINPQCLPIKVTNNNQWFLKRSLRIFFKYVYMLQRKCLLPYICPTLPVRITMQTSLNYLQGGECILLSALLMLACLPIA